MRLDDVTEIAVAGPGLMGLGIAQVCAGAGLRVRLLGRNEASAQAGHKRLAEQLGRQVGKGRIPAAEAAALLGRIVPARDARDLAQCLVAVESVPEDRTLKHDVLAQLESALPPDALIATNTSGLPVSGLAKALRHPERFLGLHFFSPVDRMPLVEVVRGELTSPATLREGIAFVERLRKSPVVVRDSPGFFTSRVFAAYLDEAIAMVGEGVDVHRIEQAALELGRSIAPLALMDDISLAMNLQQIVQAKADGLPPARCRSLAEPVLRALVARGRRGRQEGGGFYDTTGDGQRVPWPGMPALFPPAVLQPGASQIAARLRCAEVIEALRCLEDGVIESADDADTASVLGLGFPSAQGGVLRWAETRGLPALVGECDALAQAHGARFKPSDWLRRQAAAGSGLSAFRNPSNKVSALA